MAMALLVGLAIAAQPEAQAVIRPAETLDLSGRQLRLGDLAQVVGTDRAFELERRVVAMLPESRRAVQLSRVAIANLVRRAVPGLMVRGGPAMVLIRRDSTRPAPPRSACVALATSVAAGAMLRRSDLTPVACAGDRRERVSIRVDRRSGTVHAGAALHAGTYLGQVSLPPPPEILRGQSLNAVSTVGSVHVERSVVALQSGRSGGRVFVRDEAGQVFAAPVALAPEDRQ
jgi:flagella basal body P-ring formation protein FlgA